MSMFYCEICNEMKDGDWVESYEYDGGEACIDCVCELEEDEYNEVTGE